jgi:hypothetical protein
MGSFTFGAEFFSKNRRLRHPARDRVQKIVPRRINKIMCYLHYKNVAKQRRIVSRENLLKAAAIASPPAFKKTRGSPCACTAAQDF